MDYIQKGVTEFHKTFGIPTADKPVNWIHHRVAVRRLNLIQEEFDELKTALVAEDPIEIADCLADIIYVV